MKPYVPIFTPLLLIALSASLFAASAPHRPKVVVRDSGLAHSDFITLGDIADITPSPRASKASARLAAAVIGRAPLEGVTRSFNRGDISLKLRQCGIDPQAVDLEGAALTTVGSGDVAAPPANPEPPAPLSPGQSAEQPAVSKTLVHAGDPVDVLVSDGPVTVHARAVALNGGGAGQTIRVRREGGNDGSSQPISVTVVAAGQTQLEE